MLNIKKDIKEHKLKGCYLLYGSESYLVKTYEENLKKAALGGGDDIMNSDTFDDRKLMAKTVIDSAETLPFLAEKRVVIVRDSGFFKQGKKDETEAIAEYISNIPETTVIVFSESEVDKRNAAYKAAAKYGYAAEFKTPSEKELIAWVIREMKKRGVSIDGKNAAYLIRTVNADMTGAAAEMDKLAAYAGEKGSVDIKAIDEVCVKNPELKIFDMVGAMGAKNAPKAIDIYNNMLLYNESPIGILAMITRQFRLMYECALMLDKGENITSIAAKLGIRDYMARDFCRQSGNFSISRLRQALNACLEADVGIKSGRIKDSLAVELILMEYSV